MEILHQANSKVFDTWNNQATRKLIKNSPVRKFNSGAWREFYLQLEASQKKGCFGELANCFLFLGTVNFSLFSCCSIGSRLSTHEKPDCNISIEYEDDNYKI